MTDSLKLVDTGQNRRQHHIRSCALAGVPVVPVTGPVVHSLRNLSSRSNGLSNMETTKLE